VGTDDLFVSDYYGAFIADTKSNRLANTLAIFVQGQTTRGYVKRYIGCDDLIGLTIQRSGLGDLAVSQSIVTPPIRRPPSCHARLIAMAT
jgi:hypothetical protein